MRICVREETCKNSVRIRNIYYVGKEITTTTKNVIKCNRRNDIFYSYIYIVQSTINKSYKIETIKVTIFIYPSVPICCLPIQYIICYWLGTTEVMYNIYIFIKLFHFRFEQLNIVQSQKKTVKID